MKTEKPSGKTCKVHAFFDDSSIVLRRLEKEAKLPSGDLALKGRWKKVAHPDMLELIVDTYEIHSKTHGKVVGSFQMIPNPFGPNGLLFEYREFFRESKYSKPAFAGGGSITIK